MAPLLELIESFGFQFDEDESLRERRAPDLEGKINQSQEIASTKCASADRGRCEKEKQDKECSFNRDTSSKRSQKKKISIEVKNSESIELAREPPDNIKQIPTDENPMKCHKEKTRSVAPEEGETLAKSGSDNPREKSRKAGTDTPKKSASEKTCPVIRGDKTETSPPRTRSGKKDNK